MALDHGSRGGSAPASGPQRHRMADLAERRSPGFGWRRVSRSGIREIPTDGPVVVPTRQELVRRFLDNSLRTSLFGILYRKIAVARRNLGRDNEIDDIEEVFELRFDDAGSWTRPPLPADAEAYYKEGNKGTLPRRLTAARSREQSDPPWGWLRPSPPAHRGCPRHERMGPALEQVVGIVRPLPGVAEVGVPADDNHQSAVIVVDSALPLPAGWLRRPPHARGRPTDPAQP